MLDSTRGVWRRLLLLLLLLVLRGACLKYEA
jgi:hypothetical protein